MPLKVFGGRSLAVTLLYGVRTFLPPAVPKYRQPAAVWLASARIVTVAAGLRAINSKQQKLLYKKKKVIKIIIIFIK